jgi:hypothetical protein
MRDQSIHLQPTTDDDGSKTDLVRHDALSLFEAEDGSKHEPVYPPAWKVAMITVGLALAVFCLSLVCHHHLLKYPQLTFQGQHDPRNCDPQYNRRIQLAGRRWVVRELLPPRNMRPERPLRQTIHLLLHQMGLPRCAGSL